MVHHKTAQEKFNQLRRQAEQLMVTPGFSKTLVEMEDPLRLIHELQTFQVELELQNDELRRAHQELMDFKIHYTQLFDFTPVGYVILDSKGNILNANLTLTRMLSTERSTLMDRPLSDHIVSVDQDIYYLHLRALSKSKKRQICELKMKKTGGKIFDVQLESTVIPDTLERFSRYRTVIIDISARKQTDLLLQYGKKQLESVLNNIDSFIYITDMSSYEILFMNTRMKKFFTGQT
jgi:PAS domain S-box-containing protein